MERFGGPVWHVSTSSRIAFSRAALEARAEWELRGHGDATLGEWREWTGRAMHIRRRLTPDEQALVGPPVDVRRTPEAARRARAIGRRLMRMIPAEVLADELGDLR